MESRPFPSAVRTETIICEYVSKNQWLIVLVQRLVFLSL